MHSARCRNRIISSGNNISQWLVMEYHMKRSLLFVLFLIILSGSRAIANPVTCSGKIWNIWTDKAGVSWLEIGHGINQCSVKDIASANAKKILSVCSFNTDCSVHVNAKNRSREELANRDSFEILDDDQIVLVRKGLSKNDSDNTTEKSDGAYIDQDAAIDDAMEKNCNFNYNELRCRKACAEAESSRGKNSAYDGVSHATQKTCSSLLRASEAKEWVGDKACSPKSCLYRLRKSGKSKGMEVYSGSGYVVTVKKAPYPQYAGGYLYYLKDTSGRITRFEQCGSCGISELEYEAGPLKEAVISSGSKGEIMVSIPR
jgi:hypothetical protein